VKFVIDENVSFAVVEFLRANGHEAIAISETATAGLADLPVFELTRKEQAILVTRDRHFTNPIRFPAAETSGIIYLRRGNLTSEQEVRILRSFLLVHAHEEYDRKLVTLYQGGAKIR
jgi:predicted nuclease of predicted toxin-antitoxin system